MNYNEEWIKEVKVTDVPKSFQEIVRVIGIEAAAKLSATFGGLPLYIPKIDALLERTRNDLIRRDVRIMGYRQTALKYGLTEVWIRQIADHKSDDQQCDLFAESPD